LDIFATNATLGSMSRLITKINRQLADSVFLHCHLHCDGSDPPTHVIEVYRK